MTGRNPLAFSLQPSEKTIKYYQLGDSLGKGAFGKVFRGLNQKTGEVVAIKQVEKELLAEVQIPGIMRELKLMQELSHPNVVRFIDYVETEHHLYFILEYVEGGSLFDAVKKFGKFPERLLVLYITQVLRGIQYIHSRGLIHRDIKGANILLTKDGLCKLADFGSCTYANQKLSMVGSPFWMAPEIIEGTGAGPLSDIWGVGCLILELLNGQPPYWNVGKTLALFRMVEDRHPPYPENLSPELESFLNSCFTRDFHQRPSAEQLLHHSWITSIWRTTPTTAPTTDPPPEEPTSGRTRASTLRGFATLFTGTPATPPTSHAKDDLAVQKKDKKTKKIKGKLGKSKISEIPFAEERDAKDLSSPRSRASSVDDNELSKDRDKEKGKKKGSKIEQDEDSEQEKKVEIEDKIKQWYGEGEGEEDSKKKKNKNKWNKTKKPNATLPTLPSTADVHPRRLSISSFAPAGTVSTGSSISKPSSPERKVKSPQRISPGGTLPVSSVPPRTDESSEGVPMRKWRTVYDNYLKTGQTWKDRRGTGRFSEYFSGNDDEISGTNSLPMLSHHESEFLEESLSTLAATAEKLENEQNARSEKIEADENTRPGRVRSNTKCEMPSPAIATVNKKLSSSDNKLRKVIRKGEDEKKETSNDIAGGQQKSEDIQPSIPQPEVEVKNYKELYEKAEAELSKMREEKRTLEFSFHDLKNTMLQLRFERQMLGPKLQRWKQLLKSNPPPIDTLISEIDFFANSISANSQPLGISQLHKKSKSMSGYKTRASTTSKATPSISPTTSHSPRPVSTVVTSSSAPKIPTTPPNGLQADSQVSNLTLDNLSIKSPGNSPMNSPTMPLTPAFPTPVISIVDNTSPPVDSPISSTAPPSNLVGSTSEKPEQNNTLLADFATTPRTLNEAIRVLSAHSSLLPDEALNLSPTFEESVLAQTSNEPSLPPSDPVFDSSSEVGNGISVSESSDPPANS